MGIGRGGAGADEVTKHEHANLALELVYRFYDGLRIRLKHENDNSTVQYAIHLEQDGVKALILLGNSLHLKNDPSLELLLVRHILRSERRAEDIAVGLLDTCAFGVTDSTGVRYSIALHLLSVQQPVSVELMLVCLLVA